MCWVPQCTVYAMHRFRGGGGGWHTTEDHVLGATNVQCMLGRVGGYITNVMTNIIVRGK